MGKACDQIQMLVDVVPAVDMMGNLSYFCDICFSPDCRKRVRIGGLDSYFQLNQSRTHGRKEVQLLLIQKICCDFKMEVRNAVVIFPDKLPDCHGVGFFTVKGAVHKLYLRYSGI